MAGHQRQHHERSHAARARDQARNLHVAADVHAEQGQRQRKQEQHRHRVEQPLHDDRGERGWRAQAFAARQQVRAQDFAGARRQEEIAHEANHRHAQHDGVSRVTDRFAAVPASEARAACR